MDFRGVDLLPSGRAMAEGLGWFSVGLGLAELLAGRELARALGMEDQEATVRAFGVREIGTGAGILTQPDPTPWLWARVAGDALDLAALAAGLGRDNPRRGNVTIAMAAVAGVAVLDVVAALRSAAERDRDRLPPPPRLPLADYAGRSGFPQPPEAMRGAARDFEVPRDMRIPEPLRPYASG